MTPDQAVRDWLRKMGEVSTTMSAHEVPDSIRLAHAPFPAVLSSMEVLKRREAPGRQVQALAYEDAAGSAWFWIVRLIEDEAAYGACGGGGGGGEQDDPDRPHP